MGIESRNKQKDLIEKIRNMPKLASQTTYQKVTNSFNELVKSESIDFLDWLMTNCELSEDQTIWSYNSEDYSLEGIYEVYKNHIKP